MLSKLREHLPDVPVILAYDDAGRPYGQKSEAEVAARVCGLLGRMAERYSPRLICIACNTASTIALPMVRDVLEVPIVGTVPAIKPAAAMTKTGTIGLIGTRATINQPYVDRLEAEFAAGKRLLRIAAPDLVDVAEAKLRKGAYDHAKIASTVADLRNMDGGADIDTVVLACTHFPLLAEELSASFGPNVALIDGAEGIARRIAVLLGGQTFTKSAADKAVTTGSIAALDSLKPALAMHGIDQIDRF